MAQKKAPARHYAGLGGVSVHVVLPQGPHLQPGPQHQHRVAFHSPGSQSQVCRSHWSEQRLWAGQGDETQGAPTLQPVSTLTVLDGRGRGGESGLTPNRTPCRKRERSMFRVLSPSHLHFVCSIFPASHHPPIHQFTSSVLTCMHPFIPF